MRRRSHHTDYRGNTRDRKVRRAWLLKTFGNGRTVPCFWCGRRLRTRFEVDRHPRAGGRYTRDNIVPACVRCNRGRNNHSWRYVPARPYVRSK